MPKEEVGVIRVFWNALHEAGTLLLWASVLEPLSIESKSFEASVEHTFDSCPLMSRKLLSAGFNAPFSTRYETLVDSTRAFPVVMRG